MIIWFSEFTKECDKFLCNGYELDVDGTYLWGDEDDLKKENSWIRFRVPSATRGGIKVVDGIIVDIWFDADMCFGKIGCYKKEIEPYIKNKFIGTKFNIPIVDITREQVK